MSLTIKSLIALTFFICADLVAYSSKLSVLFHPYPSDSIFIPVSELIRNEMYNRIDIAMYSMEVDEKSSEIIEALYNQRERIIDGRLKVRVIFEGYESNCSKCIKLERLGVDVRQIRSKQVHHKFGVFYNEITGDSTVVTGSGNWSKSSTTRYDENMFIIEDDTRLAKSYLEEFHKLWDYYKESRLLSQDEIDLNTDDDFDNDIWDGFGADLHFSDVDLKVFDSNIETESSIVPYFNSINYSFGDSGNLSKSRKNKFVLTKKLVNFIDSARFSIDMATPRISLRPVYDALVRALERGVIVRIMSTEAEYGHPYMRDRSSMGKLFSCSQDGNSMEYDQWKIYRKTPEGRCCSRKRSGVLVFDQFESSCSTSQNHIKFLNDEYGVDDNLNIRLKLFSFYPKSSSISRQMHAKFTIVDGEKFLGGSFNYSYNSEYNLFENMIEVNGLEYPEALDSIQEKFERIWQRDRGWFFDFEEDFETAHKDKTKIECPSFDVSLEYSEIKTLLSIKSKYRNYKSHSDVCR